MRLFFISMFGDTDCEGGNEGLGGVTAQGAARPGLQRVPPNEEGNSLL